jgi:threonine synthase
VTPIATIEWEGAPLALKLDQLFASGSYKDRGAAVLVSKAREWGVASVVADSSGNAGSAIAAYCARAGITCTVFVPGGTPRSKLAQMELSGARVVEVPGDREAAASEARAVAASAFYASHCWNPHFLHGTKTVAYELYEQCLLEGAIGARALPDALVLPAGNGTLLLGAHIGFAELLRAGAIAKSPALWAVQSSACRPVYDAFHGQSAQGAVGPTIAEGVAIARPPRLEAMVGAVRASGGGVIAVGDDAVAKSALALARVGLFVEPTAALAVAAVGEVRKRVGASARVLVVLTGHGLKSADKLAALAGG